LGEMKSAWEKAQEKVEKLGKLTEEETKQFECIPVGNKLAAKYLQDINYNLDAELMKYKGTGLRKYIAKGAQEIFMHNIILPQNERDKQMIQRSMAGLRIVKENKSQLETILDRITNLLNYYDQARQQTYTQFKKGFEARLKESSQALQKQTGNTVPIEAQLQAQFQAEWLNLNSQLNSQYEKVLEEHKQHIQKIA
jgi:phosphomannomutase